MRIADARGRPGVGGTIFAGLVGIVVSYYLPPWALAVVLHWSMLRGP